jgi:hypothetical protein
MLSRIFFLLSLSLISAPALHARTDVADQFILFVSEPDADTSSDCTQRGGLRVFVVNQHPDQIIDLQIDRYFDNVRQAGRSMFALDHGHKLALGCDIVMDSPQRWELINAEFITREQAEKRYGVIY